MARGSVFLLTPATARVALYMQTLIEYPPRQSPESWSPGDVMENIKKRAAALKAGAAPG